jgi:hypothetical protein
MLAENRKNTTTSSRLDRASREGRMTDEIRELLDYLVTCKEHLEHGVYQLAPYWQGEYDRTRDELADVWASEITDAKGVTFERPSIAENR